MNAFTFRAANEDDTQRFGRMLAEALGPDTVVGLVGTLGAGKTRLVQAAALGMRVDPESVTSPTFVLINEYFDGRLPIYHADMYRIRDEDELAELGLEEYFSAGGVTFVEWADRFPDFLPEDRLTIEIQALAATEREFSLTGAGPQSRAILEQLHSHGK